MAGHEGWEMKPFVYLAGQIEGQTYQGATDWRRSAESRLMDHGILALSPMRGKHLLAAGISKDYRDYADKGPFYTAKGIMTRDYNDVARASALLVNLLGLTNRTTGTIMELAWAWQLRIPAIVVMERSGNPHDNHPMLEETMPFRFDNMDDAIAGVLSVLGV
jgi:nucleoside 2-deoxyribosyltransferase